MRLLLISHPFPWASGGGKRNFEVLKHFKECGHEATLVFSPFSMKLQIDIIKKQKKDIQCFFDYVGELEKKGIVIHQGSKQFIYDIFYSDSSPNRAPKILLFISAIFQIFVIDHMISDYIKKYARDLDGSYDFVYAHHENLDVIMLAHRISTKLNVPFVFLLQSEPYKLGYILVKNQKISTLKEFIFFIQAIFLNYSSYFLYHKAMNLPLFKGLFAISPSPVMISGLTGIPHKIINPSNAFDPSLLQYRVNPSGKENYALFFSRFSPEKGIFEIPLILKTVVQKIPDLHVILYGMTSESIINKFHDISHKLSVEDALIYRGFIYKGDELHHAIHRAMVTIHPSHSDSFSLSILESLALGTPVVAYAIPAFNYYYKKFEAVRLVKEGDIPAMSAAIVDIITHYEKYHEALENEDLIEFLHQHSSWKKVAQAELESFASL